jgi:CRISPR-associated protein Cmr4
MAKGSLTGIYTLTPMHCGTGQTAGAVDLPIARETHTGFPILPASSLKGAARQAIGDMLDEKDRDGILKWLFGSDVAKDGPGGDTSPGSLIILEGRLFLYPIRSLQRPFLYATCPLIVERLLRDLRALGITVPGVDWQAPRAENRVYVASGGLKGKALVLEDLAYRATEVFELSAAKELTGLLSGLLPAQETAARERMTESLVVMPDNDFGDAVRRTTPVQARIRLGADKTTTGDDGNLWYEETLPGDCLFTVLIAAREGANNGKEPCAEFQKYLGDAKAIQIGGNETVGQGYCWWTPHSAGLQNADTKGQAHG